MSWNKKGNSWRRVASLCAVAAGSFQFLSGWPMAAQAKPRGATPPSTVQSYASVDECIISHRIEEALCRTGFANAKAEFEEKAPRFSSRQACEASFAQCSVFVSTQPPSPADLARRGSGPEFVPIMDHIEIVNGKNGAAMVMPSARSSRIRPAFAARALATIDSEVSAKRGEVARQSWQAALIRSARPPEQAFNASGNGPVRVNYSDPQAASATDQPASYPVSAKRWNQMQSDIARLKKGKAPDAAK